MTDKRRIVLLIALGLIAVLFVGDKIYQNLYATPLRTKQGLNRSLNEELHDTKLQIKLAQKKLPQVDELQARSLPYDLELAISAYRSWLFELIKKTGLKRTNVDYGQPIRVGRLYDRLTFSMRGSGSLEQVVRFLHEFYSAGQLHKIRSLTINPTATGRVDVSISIEALALLSASSEDTLPDVDYQRLASDDYSAYSIIAKRNVFSSSPGSWLTETKVSAVTKNADGTRQVWLDTPNEIASLIVEEGQSVTVAGHTIRVTNAGEGQATLTIDDDELIIRVGQSLAEAIQ